MITYDFVTNSNQAVIKVKVKLNGKMVGSINPVIGGGWQYFPSGQKKGGDVMKSITLVQKSLESE